MLGRKRIYGYEVLVLAAGAIASAFSPDIWWLIGFRIILGVGIGGDYPVSATLMSEFAGKKSRGMMVSLVFAMQAAGLMVGPLLAAALLASGLSHDLTGGCCWRSARSRRWRCSRCAGTWRKARAICSRPASTRPPTRRRPHSRRDATAPSPTAEREGFVRGRLSRADRAAATWRCG